MAVMEKEKSIVPVREPFARLEPLFTEWPSLRSPFGLLDRVRDEMDRIFEGFGVPRTLAKYEDLWMPKVELLQRKGELVVRAELPGMKREDVTVEVTEDGLALTGERKREEKEEKEGYYRTEREYGKFSRFIPFPDGAIFDKAAATFKDGVLEVVVPVPKLEALAPKKLEIK